MHLDFVPCAGAAMAERANMPAEALSMSCALCTLDWDSTVSKATSQV